MKAVNSRCQSVLLGACRSRSIHLNANYSMEKSLKGVGRVLEKSVQAAAWIDSKTKWGRERRAGGVEMQTAMET